MLLEQKIEQLLEELLSQKSIEIVRIKYSNNILQILIERMDDKRISIGECEEASKLISRILDIEEILDKKYSLEVGSPGLDRPLVKLKDYVKFMGEEAKFTLLLPVNEHKKFKAKIMALESDDIKLLLDNNEEILVKFDNILSANLVVKIKFE